MTHALAGGIEQRDVVDEDVRRRFRLRSPVLRSAAVVLRQLE
jgi:hypothetical protein